MSTPEALYTVALCSLCYIQVNFA